MLLRRSVVRGLMVLVLAALQQVPALAAQAMVTAGDSHTCAVTAAGVLKCWGSNLDGELGDRTFTERHLPVDVSGMASGLAAITAGGDHSCALSMAGGIKCWGSNYDGELGDNSAIDSHVPVDVSGLTSNAVAVAAGLFHTCALTTAGGVQCWGDNSQGQLGDNSTTSRRVPVSVSGLASGVAAIAAGERHTCALTTAGGVKCWGYNHYGQLGDNTTTGRHMPIAVSGLSSGVTAIAAGGDYTCAVTTAGGAKCWGFDGARGTGPLPIDVAGLGSGVASIAVGGSHACALTTAGGVKCWGNDSSGQLGDSANYQPQHLTPVDVSGLTSGVAAIAAGNAHTCALTAAGGFKCWGLNDHGHLGDNTISTRRTPVDVMGIVIPGATVPDAPAIGTATPGNAQATVRFTPRANTGGVPIIAYTLTASPGGMTAMGSISPITITGLSNGTSYVFTVTATNAVGTSAASTASAAVTPIAPVLTFAAGWNLVGNGVEAPLAVAEVFNDASKVTTVWKWISAGTTPGIAYPTWAFYSPTQSDGGLAYAAGKGYDFLTTINGGEGFWLNAPSAFTAALPGGAAVQASSFMPAVPTTAGGSHALPQGWSLIAVGNNPTPAQFDAAIATALSVPPPAGSAAVYRNLNALWAWDAANQRWYFWAPSLVNSGGLAAYLAGKGYRDFTAMPATPSGTLSPTTGFWINMP